MELAQIICCFLLLLAFVLPLLKLSVCLPITSSPKERNLPYMTSDVRQVSGKSFDYIVVGGGTTGCSLAATLSESFSVLLVERGGSPYGNRLVEDKKYYGFSLIQTDEFTSVAQAFTSKDGVINHRGRVLGGASAINGGIYSRASKDFVKQAGWDEDLVMEAYGWVESKIVFMPELTLWQSVVQFGFLEAGILPYNGFNLEHIEGTKISGSVFDNWGKRHTSADLLEAGNPKNITVLLNATVENVIIHRNGMNESRVRGIKFIKSDGSTSQSYRAYLNKSKKSRSRSEIILSAGALGSPQLLLLSGIGPHKHLKNLNIPVKVELDGVGRGMIDNPGIALLADIKPQKMYPDTPQVVGITKGFKFIVEAGIIPISFNATRMPIAIKIAFPTSRGKLELNSTDPRQNPLVEFNYLTNKHDLEQCAEMAQLVGGVARSESISFFVGNEPKNSFTSSSEEELKRFCKKNVGTYYHYHGGCAVGSVVDKDYTVYGVKGLRVIDGSTLKESPGTNPMATLMMLGRYQGIKILSERKDA